MTRRFDSIQQDT